MLHLRSTSSAFCIRDPITSFPNPNMSPSLPRPARKVRKINYYDGDAGSDVDVTFERPPLRDLRRSARVRSYAEAPSDVDRDSGSETDEDRSRISSAESQGLSQPSRTPKAIVMRRRRQPRRPLSTGRQQTLANLPKQKPRAVAHVGLRKPSIPETNALPWQHLEHGILVSILEYASAAMGDSPSNLDPHHSAVQWLLKVSRLSNPFHEAATTIIYRVSCHVPSQLRRTFRSCYFLETVHQNGWAIAYQESYTAPPCVSVS